MKRFFKFSGLILLGLLVLSTFIYLFQKSKPKKKAYQIETVKLQSIEKRTVATGKVLPRNEVLIKPQLSGIIEEIYKHPGESVETGDVIAKIKVVPDMLNLSSAESRLEKAKLEAEHNEHVFARDKMLFASKVISREEYEASELKYQNSKEEMRAAQDNVSLVKTGITPNTAKYSNTLVRATVSGTILDIPIKVGNSVIQANTFNDGTTIASVADLGDMLFEGKIDETEVGRLNIGMPVDIVIGALQGHHLDAQLEYIAPKGVEENGAMLFEIKAALKLAPNLFVRAGYSANAEIILDKRDSVLAIPESCVSFSGNTHFVYMVKNEKEQEFEKKTIETGLSDGMDIEVKSGLSRNDKIRGNEIISQ